MRKDGSLKKTSVKHCQVPTGNQPVEKSWYAHEPLYLQWKEWNCKSECRYHCMMESESEKEQLGLGPVKYHGKWPLKRASVFQEPISAALSALALLVQFNGWLSFFLPLSYKLPPRLETHKTYYEYTGLWHIYGLLSMNAWFWRAIYHSCDTFWTEKLYYSSVAAFIGYSLILAILRTLNLRDEASRVMVAAPILAFTTTHILYLNFNELDKELSDVTTLLHQRRNLLRSSLLHQWQGLLRRRFRRLPLPNRRMRRPGDLCRWKMAIAGQSLLTTA